MHMHMRQKIRNGLYAFIALIWCSMIPISVQAEDLNITVLDVGQGLSVLFESDDHYMIYDGGGREKSSYVVSYLKKQGISEFDYVVASHYDEDHISGLVGVLNAFACKTVLSPDYEADSAIYNSFINAESKPDIEVIHPIQGEVYSFGTSDFQILNSDIYQDVTDNNNSIALKVTKKEVSCLVCGDAEAKEEDALLSSGLDLEADIYIVNHHGSGSSSTEEFLNQINPSIAVISCGSNNVYGHPEAGVLERLQKQGCYLLRTDIQGEIILSTEGEHIYFELEPCENWNAGNVQVIPDEVPTYSDFITTDSVNDNGVMYVCNENTKKFHYPTCNSVSQMKEKNRRDTNQSREDLLSQGYDPCKNCNP